MLKTRSARHYATLKEPCTGANPGFLPVMGAALIALLSSPLAIAQSGLYFVPLITVEEVYDDNIFFQQSEDEVSDFITRVSPQLDVGFESETLNWLLSYRNDAEWYRDLSDLDSTTARGFGLGRIEYTPDRRLTLRGETQYVQTNSVQDLTLTPGGGIPGRVGRAEAERWLFGAGAGYRFSPRWNGDIDVTWVDDELIDFSTNETLSGVTQLEQILTPARSLLYGYQYRNYEFENDVGVDPIERISESEDSNTLWLGLTQELSERSELEVRAGPRFSSSETDPYFLFDWRRNYERGSTSIRALWDETTLLGEVGRQESRSIYATWTHEFSADLEVSGTAGYAYLSGEGFSTDITSFDVSGIYRFNRAIYLTARYGFNIQEQDPARIQGARVTRNVVSIAITFTRPRRGAERSSS